MPTAYACDLPQALQGLRDALAGARLGLTTPGGQAARQVRADLVRQVDDYLLPRLRQSDAPLLAVVGGSTGAGKSTLVNSLVEADVTRAGWLRPTTRGPVLVCHPQDLPSFEQTEVLPDLPRSSGQGDDPTALALRPNDRLPPGLALLDAPDIDSVVERNRHLARQLLAAADLWVFVTSAARYADAVPWDLLHSAQQRGAALAVVLNRTPPEGMTEIRSHLAGMLDDAGLSRATLFAVPEVTLARDDERLPPPAVASLKDWLTALAQDAQARSQVIRTTLDGALANVSRRVGEVAHEVDEQVGAAGRLRGEAEAAYADALLAVDDGVRGGAVLRGEVLARWQEFVGTGEFTRSLEQRIGRLRDRVGAVLTGRPAPAHAVEEALESSVHALVRAVGDGAAERVVDTWRVRPAGRELLAGVGGDVPPDPLDRSSPQFGGQLEHQLRQWQEFVLQLVAREGEHKRTVARVASLGTNGAGLALMLAVFAHTGGLTGAEVAVAGGTSAAGHKVLEAVFGDSAVRSLAARARADLLARVEQLFAAEQARFTDLVDAAAPGPGGGVELRASLAGFDRARRAAQVTP